MPDEKLQNGTMRAVKSGIKALESPPTQLSEADLDNIMEHLSDEALEGVAGGGES